MTSTTVMVGLAADQPSPSSARQRARGAFRGEPKQRLPVMTGLGMIAEACSSSQFRELIIGGVTPYQFTNPAAVSRCRIDAGAGGRESMRMRRVQIS